MPVDRIFAVLAAIACMALTLPAVAADLYAPSTTSEHDAYQDPRYRDMYGYPPPPPPQRYAAPYTPYGPYDRPGPSYRDQRGYLRPMAPPAYEPLPRRGRYAVECLAPHVIRARLERSGWHGFQDLGLDGQLAIIQARAANGRRYELSVDRCDGRLIEARMIHRRSAQAWPPQPYRDGYRGY